MSANTQSASSEKWQDADQFRSLVAEWADRIQVDLKSVHLRPMKTKWASCSTKGIVSFSTLLLEENREFGEYVIVHELLHLKIPNHGKLFKSLLSAHIPDWKARVEKASGRTMPPTELDSVRQSEQE